MRELKNEFIITPNVRNFGDLMAALERDPGVGRLACVYGAAGFGKSRTVIQRHAMQPSIYLRALAVWSGSALAFLEGLARELEAPYVPRRRSGAFSVCEQRLARKLAEAPDFTVFVDEIEKLPGLTLEIVRDLTDASGVPFVLVGERELRTAMARSQRVWSRTLEMLEFRPLVPAEVIAYAKFNADVALPAAVANVLHTASGGDFRTMRRDLGALLRLMAANRVTEPDEALAKKAVRAGMRGAA